MKKRKMLLFAAAFAMLPAMADSPYKGSVPEHGKSYYLYQVETGRWLQANMTDINSWTTHGGLGDMGLDVKLLKLEGFEGFQIYVDFNGNGELNGSDQDRGYFDQGDRALCDWIFEPANVDGVVNGYKIMIRAKEGRDRDRIEKDTYIGANDDSLFGGLAPVQGHEVTPIYTTWQLVSREERIAVDMANASKENPVDVSWLIPWFDRGRNDHREGRWQNEWSGGKGNAIDGTPGYPVQEKWSNWIGSQTITLTDLPAGTYGFTLQGFYRDSSIDDSDIVNRFRNGTDHLDRVKYFAGASEGHLMSILADTETQNLGLGGDWRDKDGINGIPNSMEAASRLMFLGHYINEYLDAPVRDGTLSIGIIKDGAVDDDWLITKRFYLKYYGEDTSGALQGLLETLSNLYQNCQNLISGPFNDIYNSDILSITLLDNAMAEADNVLKNPSADADAIISVTNNLSSVYNLFNRADVQNSVNHFFNTYLIMLNEENVEWAAEKNVPLRSATDYTIFLDAFDNATSAADFSQALQMLRYARRMRAAIFHNDNFTHQPVGEGKFYLYNVGRGQWLTNGSDWGTHAALGNPGLEITLIKSGNNYIIDSGLDNGDRHYLDYGGYMDCGMEAFAFTQVDGLDNVYTISHPKNGSLLAWDPYAPVDAGNGNETTVSTKVTPSDDGINASSPEAQWILVTKENRLALADKASINNPVDLTFLINRAGFNKKERYNHQWFINNFSIWQENENNHSDLTLESYNTPVGANFSYQLEDLPAGVYKVCIQGFYRDGKHEEQPGRPLTHNAKLFAGVFADDTDADLPNIAEQTHFAPGEGRDAVGNDVTYHYPDGMDQAAVAFRTGLYNAYTTATVRDGYTLPIGVEKTGKSDLEDWIMVDNLRIYYYGPDADEDEVALAADPNAALDSDDSGIEDVLDDILEAIGAPADGYIYDLRGVRVINPTVPGIYIQNGKKMIIR